MDEVLDDALDELHRDILVLTEQISRIRRLLLALFLRESDLRDHQALVEALVEEELKTDQHLL